MTPTLPVIDLGRRRYGPVLELQRELCRRRTTGALAEDILLLVEHEPVVTLGRSTRTSSLPLPRGLLEQRGLELFEVERGGDVTLHAPGQLVAYPILDLSGWRRDLHWYLRRLEDVLIRALDRLGVPAGRNPGKTGVWTGLPGAPRKIASIGIHVKQWVTMHGLALNVTTDLSLFQLIVPCGIPDVVMTSVAAEGEQGEKGEQAEQGGNATLRSRATSEVIRAFGEVFEREPETRALESLVTAPLG